MSVSRAKELAAREAVKYIMDANVIGVGTGTTVEYVIKVISGLRDYFSSKYFVASSLATAIKLSEANLKVLDHSSVGGVDVYIDSADMVDRNLNMIKGGGAALTLEKLLANYSRLRVIVIDYTKLVDDLRGNFIPVDVLPHAVSLITNYLRGNNYEVSIRYSTKGKYGPVISDVGGVLIDVRLPRDADLIKFNDFIRKLPGVIETGLFIGLSDIVIVGYEDRVETLTRGDVVNA